MPAGLTNSLLSLIVLLAVGLGDLAWLNFALAPELARQRAQTLPIPQKAVEAEAINTGNTSNTGSHAAVTNAAVQQPSPRPSLSPAADSASSGAAVATKRAEAVVAPPPAVESAPPPPPSRGAPPQPKEADTEPAAKQPLPSLPDVLYGTGAAGLDSSARATLRKAAKAMRADPDARLLVRGHADERGSDAYNDRLATWRAKTALQYLVALGIPARRLSMESVGAKEPADPAQTPAAWAKNRRVQLIWQ